MIAILMSQHACGKLMKRLIVTVCSNVASYSIVGNLPDFYRRCDGHGFDFRSVSWLSESTFRFGDSQSCEVYNLSPPMLSDIEPAKLASILPPDY